VAGLTLSAVEDQALMSLLSLSQAYVAAGMPDGELYAALRGMAAATRNWAHYVGLMVSGGMLLVFYGVLMLEAMAQTAALLSFATAGVTPDDKTVYYFAGIDSARFKRPVEPGDQLVMDVSLLRMKSGIYKFKGVAHVGEELACEAELMCTMRKVG
jgi:acyl dehydratase